MPDDTIREQLPQKQLQFGFLVPPTRQRVARLEELGVDSLWAAGHVTTAGPTSEPLVGLAQLSALSERALIGTAVMALPLYAPGLLAKQVADLDRIAGGRLLLGVGVGGSSPEEFRLCQVPATERGHRADESVALLRALWRGEMVTSRSRYFPMDDVHIDPLPVRHGGPPIIVGGESAAAVRRAAVLGDGWMPSLCPIPRYERSASEILRQAVEAGRDLAEFHWTLTLAVSVAPRRDDALELASRALGSYVAGTDAGVEEVSASGDVADVAAAISGYVDVGVRHFILIPCAPGMTETIMREVVPAVRAASSSTGGS
jgi:probable F420-dependent oxidoreductase